MNIQFLLKLAFLLTLININSFSQKDTLTTKSRKFVSISTDFNTSVQTQNNQSSIQNYYNSSYLSANLSLGKFVRKRDARIFSIGIAKSERIYEQQIFKGSDFRLNISYAYEKYKVFLNKFAVLGGLEVGIAYKKGVGEQIANIPNSIFNSYGESKYINGYIKAYPGFIYFINSRWALTTTIGNLNLFELSIKTSDTSKEYGVTRGGNTQIYTAYESETVTDYSFSPSFSINNSGIGIRYFLK